MLVGDARAGACRRSRCRADERRLPRLRRSRLLARSAPRGHRRRHGAIRAIMKQRMQKRRRRCGRALSRVIARRRRAGQGRGRRSTGSAPTEQPDAAVRARCAARCSGSTRFDGGCADDHTSPPTASRRSRRGATSCRRGWRRGDLPADRFVAAVAGICRARAGRAGRGRGAAAARRRPTVARRHGRRRRCRAARDGRGGAARERGRACRRRARARARAAAARRRRRARRRCSKSAPAPAATRRRCSPATCSACTSAMPTTQGWKVELISASAGRRRRLQGSRRHASTGAGRVRQAQVRKRRPPRPARAGDRERRAHPHLARRPSRCCPRPRRSTSRSTTSDLRIDIYRASGAGRAARQHHRFARCASPICPTGLVVIQQDEKSSTRTRPRRCRCCARGSTSWSASGSHAERAGARKSMVGSGDRSERIRTYNFPQGRVTDHRINLTLHRLPEILEGRDWTS